MTDWRAFFIRELGPERGHALWLQYRGRLPVIEQSSVEMVACRFRLRDVRRLLARPERLARHPRDYEVCKALSLAAANSLGGGPYDLFGAPYRPERLKLAISLADRLISRFGAGTMLSDLLPPREEQQMREELERILREIGDSRPKGTDEVADCLSGTSSATHGGDGNSGEVDSLAETTSREARENDLTSSPQPGPAASGSGGTAPQAQGAETPADPAEKADAAGSDRAGEEPSADRAAGRPGRETSSAGQSAAEGGGADLSRANEDRAPGGAQAEGAQDGAPNRGENAPAADRRYFVASAGTGTDRSPESPSMAAGLDEVRLAALRGADELRRDAAEVVRQLRRIILDASGCGSPSPRIDGRRLARELVSRRCRLGAARRREMDYGELVIAVDESGSCSGVVEATLPAARAIAREIGARAILVEHFNGDIDMRAESIHDWPAWLKRALSERSPGERRSDSVWRAIVRRRPRLVLALGDFDSHEQFEAMAQAGQRLILLTHVEQDVFATPPQTTYEVVWGIYDIHSAARVLRATKIHQGSNKE